MDPVVVAEAEVEAVADKAPLATARVAVAAHPATQLAAARGAVHRLDSQASFPEWARTCRRLFTTS